MKEIFFNAINYTALHFDGAVYSCATTGGDSIHFDGNDYLICGPLAAPVVACPADAALASATGASYTVANTGGAAASWAITSPSPVPAGISLANQSANSADVVFSNTVADGTYSITVEATNATGSDDCTFEITVGVAAVSFSNMPAICVASAGTNTSYLACDFTIRPDGTMNWGGAGQNGSEPFESGGNAGTWHDGTLTSSDYEIRFNRTNGIPGGGDASGQPIGPWHNLGTTRRKWIQLTGPGARQHDSNVEIRRVSDGVIVATSTISHDIEIS